MLELLPKEIFFIILSFGNILELIKLSHVSSNLRKYIKSLERKKVQFIDSNYGGVDEFLLKKELDFCFKRKKFFLLKSTKSFDRSLSEIGYFKKSGLFWIFSGLEFEIGKFIEGNDKIDWIPEKTYKNEIIIFMAINELIH